MAAISIETAKVTRVQLLAGSERHVEPGTFTVGTLGGVTIAQGKEDGSVYTAPMTAVALIRSGELEAPEELQIFTA